MANNNEVVKRFKEVLSQSIGEVKRVRAEDDRKRLLSTVGQDLVSMLKPFLAEVAESSKLNREQTREILQEIKGEVGSTNVPGVDTAPLVDAIERAMGQMNLPAPAVTVNIPKMDVLDMLPKIPFPHKMEVEGFVRLQGVALDSPLPVQIRDHKGNPVNLLDGLTAVISGSGGGSGGPRFITIKDIQTSTGASVIDQTEGAVKVTGTLTASGGLTDTELRAAHLDTQQVSGAIDSVNLVQIAGDAPAKGTEVNAGFLRVYQAADAVVSVNIVSGSSGGTQYDDAGNAAPGTGGLLMARDSAGSVYAARIGSGTSETALRTTFATDAIASVNIVSGSSSGTQYADGATASAPTGTLAMGDTGEESGNIFALAVGSGVLSSAVLRVVQAVNSVSSVYAQNPVAQGDSTTALRVVHAGDVVASVYAQNPVAQGDSTTALRVVHAGDVGVSVTATQTGTWNIGTVTTVTGVTNTIAAANVDSSGVQYSGSNPLPITIISGALTSTVVVGDTLHDAADIGAAPLKMGGVAMASNPTAVADGDRVNFRADDLGRQITRPVQVRDLTTTAYVQLTNGTETTLKAATAGSFHDLIYIMGANNSDAAVSVDIRAVTAGNVVITLQIPASSTAGVSLAVPYPQSEGGNNWTADMGDITGTTVSLSALFSREV